MERREESIRENLSKRDRGMEKGDNKERIKVGDEGSLRRLLTLGAK